MAELIVGASYLRSLSSDVLANLAEKIVIHVKGVPVAVVLPWAEHERLVGSAPRVEYGPAEPSPEFKAEVREMVEKVRALPVLEEIGTLLGHLLDSAEVRNVTATPGYARPERPQSLPSSHMVNCIHCGERRFGATKFATICSECKSAGHTNDPRECPRCTEGAAI